MRSIPFLLLLVALLGCDSPAPSPAGPGVRLVPPPSMIQIVDLPHLLREQNWGGGSCVHASVVNNFRWQNQEDLAAWWRSRYSGGETATGIMNKLDAVGVRYTYTSSAEPQLLEYATRTRRGAVIWYYPRHSINFCGFVWDAGKQWAVLLDNNRVEKYICVEKSRFLSEWKRYGGFGLVPIFSPTPPQPYNPYRPVYQ